MTLNIQWVQFLSLDVQWVVGRGCTCGYSVAPGSRISFFLTPLSYILTTISLPTHPTSPLPQIHSSSVSPQMLISRLDRATQEEEKGHRGRQKSQGKTLFPFFGFPQEHQVSQP